MTVTPLEISRSLLADIGTLNDDLAKFSRQVSSGKLLTQLKDSPWGSAELVALSKIESEIDQFCLNADTSSLYMNTADSALNEVSNLMATIYARGSRAASEIVSNEARTSLASEIRSLRDQIVSLANSAVRGRYIFAGSMVTTAPFSATGDVITYQGDGIVNRVQIDTGVEVQMNFSGDTVFGSILSSINALLTEIDGNNIAGIQTALRQFSSTFSDLAAARGQVGANLNVLETIKARLGTQEVNLKEHRSRIEDADMAQAIVQLQQTRTALEATMSAGGSVLAQRNLFDILG